MTKLDHTLIEKIGRRQRGGSLPMLDISERIAINLLYRQGVHMSVLMKVFKCGKNTIYGTCLTGGGAYPAGHRAIEVNKIIDQMGEPAAEHKYLTSAINAAINLANEELLANKKQVVRKRAA